MISQWEIYLQYAAENLCINWMQQFLFILRIQNIIHVKIKDKTAVNRSGPNKIKIHQRLVLYGKQQNKVNLDSVSYKFL